MPCKSLPLVAQTKAPAQSACTLAESKPRARLRATARTYGLNPGGTKWEVAERILRHERWLDSHPPGAILARVRLPKRLFPRPKYRHYKGTGDKGGQPVLLRVDTY